MIVGYFQIVPIPWLDPGSVWAAAIIVALGWAALTSARRGLDPFATYWAGVCAVVGGLLGGHLMYMMVHGWQAPFEFWRGGKSFYGALIGGGLAAAFYFRRRSLSAVAYADSSVAGVALGYCLGRVGCFLNGDDYGSLTHVIWAVVYPAGTEAYEAHLSRGWVHQGSEWSLPVHPVQLYASLTGLALFTVLTLRRSRRPGELLRIYLVGYGVARFLLEYLRGDFRPVLGPLSLPQLLSLCLVVAGFWPFLRKRTVAFGERAQLAPNLVANP